MKIWTMPHVAIEAFRANEYVAGACDPIPIPGTAYNKTYAYVDLNPQNGKIDKAGVERLSKSPSTNRYSVDSTFPHGNYNDVEIYVINPATGITSLGSGDHALDEKINGVPLFTSAGTYDIHVGSTTDVRVYPNDTWDEEDPPAKLFS